MGIKYVIEGMSDLLWMEVVLFGIDVVIVEFGGIKIEWVGIVEKKLLVVFGEMVYYE